jgi:dTDP-4-amino-4,6-dideoxygalactose transaminase
MNRDAWKRYSNVGNWFYQVVDAGYKYNITDMQAALGVSQLQRVDSMWNARKIIAEKYNEAFRGTEELAIPYVCEDCQTSWHLYVIKLNLEALSIDRDTFIERLAEKGVSTSVHFIPLYRHLFYRKQFRYKKEAFPVSEWIYARIVSLPMYPSMTGAEIEKVITVVKETLKKNKR